MNIFHRRQPDKCNICVHHRAYIKMITDDEKSYYCETGEHPDSCWEYEKKEKWMENYNQMQERHKKEMEELQAQCPHTVVSDWYTDNTIGKHIRRCEHCGSIREAMPGVCFHFVPKDNKEK